jgi:hypothetical protein
LIKTRFNSNLLIVKIKLQKGFKRGNQNYRKLKVIQEHGVSRTTVLSVLKNQFDTLKAFANVLFSRID